MVWIGKGNAQSSPNHIAWAGEQRELIFHDTVPISREDLQEARKRAKRQKDVVLAVFQWHDTRNFTPWEMYEMIKEAGGCAILTSIRRSITDLTKEGRLIKCMYSESRKGQYGTLNRTWKYNPDWTPPLNPMKVKQMRSFSQSESETDIHYIDVRDMHAHPEQRINEEVSRQHDKH